MRPHPARRGYRQQGNTGSRAAQQQMRPSKSQQSSSRLARAEGAGDSEPWQYYVGAALPGGARREAVLKGGAVLFRKKICSSIRASSFPHFLAAFTKLG